MFDVRSMNVAIEVWAVAFCLIGIASVLFFTRMERQYRMLFIAMFVTEGVSAGGDALAGIFRGQEGSLAWAATHIGNFLTYAGGFLLIVALTWYFCLRLSTNGKSTLIFRGWRIAVLVSAVVMCICALAGVFYYIDDANIYHRTDAYWVAQAYAVVVSVANAVLVIRYRRRIRKTTLACMLFYTLAPAITAPIQSLIYGLNVNIVVGVLGLIVVFLEMQAHSARMLVERSEELAQSKVEVSESRIAVMVSQIQPHFIFNTLDTIYGLCDEDPALAQKAIASFSQYLRMNLNSLKHMEPVPIETEMGHVKTYLELECMSDEDRVHYELDVQATGFNVPALAVQIIAENAVKHGLGGKEEGGTVTIRTRELANEYTVTVIDDGIGFDVSSIDHEEPPAQFGIGMVRERAARAGLRVGERGPRGGSRSMSSDGGTHIGIENARARLAAMCGGTMEIVSAPGSGTTVVMHIPKEADEL